MNYDTIEVVKSLLEVRNNAKAWPSDDSNEIVKLCDGIFIKVLKAIKAELNEEL